MGRSKKRRRSRYDEGEELKKSGGALSYAYLEEEESSMPEGITHYEMLKQVPDEIKKYDPKSLE